MKVLWVSLAMVSAVVATPDHLIEEQERYLGSTESAYAVVRERSDNMGSHYSDRRTTYLDEFGKSDGKLMSSTVLLDVKRHQDVEHEDPNSSPTVRKEVVEKNEELVWAEVLEKFNVRFADVGRSPYWSGRLRWDHEGVHFGEHRLVLGASALEEDYGMKLSLVSEETGELHADPARGSITEVIYDREWLYLQLALRQDSEEAGTKTKIVPIPPEFTKKLFDWAAMKETYLRVGRYVSLEEANAAAWAVIADCRERGIRGVNLELWKVRPATDAVEYLVVDSYSEETIRNNGVEALEKKIGSKLVPISNRGFEQRWEPIPPKEPGDVSPELVE